VLAALQRDLAHVEFDQLLVTGDLTHIGLPQEFEQARDWLRALGAPNQVAVVPGNHDAYVAAAWRNTFALWQDYMASDHERGDQAGTMPFPSLRIRGSIAFIGLSTACPTLPLMATGTLGEQQLSRLPGLLHRAREDGLFRVVYLHHCPVPGLQRIAYPARQPADHRRPLGLGPGLTRRGYRPLQPLSGRTRGRRLAAAHRGPALRGRVGKVYRGRWPDAAHRPALVAIPQQIVHPDHNPGIKLATPTSPVHSCYWLRLNKDIPGSLLPSAPAGQAFSPASPILANKKAYPTGSLILLPAWNIGSTASTKRGLGCRVCNSSASIGEAGELHT
jgi:Calcineurin-like phosphoesterase